jgi:hypothetical protein
MSEKLNITYRQIKELKPYKKNAKKHNKEQVEQIANSIKEFGFTQPVIIDKHDCVVAGHGRILGAKKAGLKQVPTVCLDELTEEQIKAYRLVDNKLNESEWDKKTLKEELDELYGSFSMEDFGFGISIENIDLLQEGKREIAPELGEANNYIVLEFDTEQEWEDAQFYFDLKEVETPDKNPKIRRKGIGRVIKGKDILEILKERYEEENEH